MQHLLGCAARERGDLEAAFARRAGALPLDPRHRGVLEYVGEAGLVAGTPARAEEHLAALDRYRTVCGEE